jgi:competence protein ComEA
MISQNGEEPAAEAKPIRKSDSKLSKNTKPKGAIDTEQKTIIDAEPKTTMDIVPNTAIETEQKATIEAEQKATIDTEQKATIDTEQKASAPSSTELPKLSVTPNEKPEASLPAARYGQLDLNTATLKQLDELPGIGESKAKAILDYRLKKGRFSRIEELMEVKGIGEKMLEKLKVFLYVTSP